ncbi:MAG: monovalent cation/H(+) antiporter subunit G [Hyphomicrobiaceae bacterium]|nr:monovalent cation/H(+) antiporter subunit G [Hyphomicrobiaceae bacterium]
MAWLADIIGGILILAGAFFFVVGAVGIYRMPDVFARMHAAGISDTVGAGLLILGMMFLAGFTLVSAKLAVIFGIIFFTSPIATHALAQAALHEGLEPVGIGKKVLTGPGVNEDTAKPGGTERKSASARTRKTSRKPASSTKRKTTRRSASKKTSRPNRRTRS